MEETTQEIENLRKRIDEANDQVWNLRASPKADYEPEKMIQQALQDSKKIGYLFGEARCLLNTGMGAFVLHHNYPLSEELINKSIAVFREIRDLKWESNALLTQAIIKNSTGSPETALYLGLKGIQFYLDRSEDFDFTMAFYVVGTIYKDLKKNEEAERYYKIGVTYKGPINSWHARIYTGLSNILTERQEYKEALIMGQRALELLRIEDNKIGISRALNDLGSIHHRLKEYDTALRYIYEALAIRKENNIKHFVLGSLIDIAGIYFEQGKFDQALPVYFEAEPLAVETSHTGRLAIIYSKLAEIFKTKGDLHNALEYCEKLIQVNKTISQQEKEAKISQSENKLLKEKEDEIERLRNVELKNAYDLIAEKNKEITDSIHYAHRIQKTILSKPEELENYLRDYFVFFQPKDIVSGDFYWSIVMTRESGDEDFYLAVCDSTGHGVPGAFMSLLNTNYLNEAIYEKQISEPHLVLNYVREKLIYTISSEGQKDGFDGILIRYNAKMKIIQYAAANNAPLLIRAGKIIELPTDKMPVGHGEKTDSFRLNKIDLQSGDRLYLYTDGYADQFGGPKGKKYKTKNLALFLQQIAGESSKNQLEKIKAEFENWKGSLEQVDDVCLIGIRV